jgi:DnaJ domain
MADDEDYYAILQVAPNATEEDIRLAFRRLARLYHPDVAGTGSLAEMQRLNVAYQTLSHPERRLQYDLSRGHVPAAPPDVPNRPAPTRPAAPAGSPRPSSPRRASVTQRPGPFRHIATLTAPDPMPVTNVAFAQASPLAGAGLIDGRVLVFDLTGPTLLRTLTFGSLALAGVLHEVRISPSGMFAAAWGFELGTRVWRIDTGKVLWTLGASAPAGSMDVALTEQPQQVRLAVPDAPLALADEDPFRWAHEGRHGTTILTRPFGEPLTTHWTQPLQCPEPGRVQGARGDWFVNQRILSRAGDRLLTLASVRADGETRKGLLRLWEIEHRAVFGTTRPRSLARLECPPGGQWYPLTATPDLSRVALGHLGRSMHVLSVEGGQHQVIDTGPVSSEARAALAPDGSRLALARGTALDVWDARSGTPLASWQFAAEVTAVEFVEGPSGIVLGVGLANGLVDLWG